MLKFLPTKQILACREGDGAVPDRIRCPLTRALQPPPRVDSIGLCHICGSEQCFFATETPLFHVYVSQLTRSTVHYRDEYVLSHMSAYARRALLRILGINKHQIYP